MVVMLDREDWIDQRADEISWERVGRSFGNLRLETSRWLIMEEATQDFHNMQADMMEHHHDELLDEKLGS